MRAQGLEAHGLTERKPWQLGGDGALSLQRHWIATAQRKHRSMRRDYLERCRLAVERRRAATMARRRRREQRGCSEALEALTRSFGACVTGAREPEIERQRRRVEAAVAKLRALTVEKADAAAVEQLAVDLVELSIRHAT